MKLNKNGQDYERFKLIEGWAFVNIDTVYKYRRTKPPQALLDKRQAHMVKMYNEGSPYSWIAKLYDMSREHVRRIIHNLPNH